MVRLKGVETGSGDFGSVQLRRVGKSRSRGRAIEEPESRAVFQPHPDFTAKFGGFQNCVFGHHPVFLIETLIQEEAWYHENLPV